MNLLFSFLKMVESFIVKQPVVITDEFFECPIITDVPRIPACMSVLGLMGMQLARLEIQKNKILLLICFCFLIAILGIKHCRWQCVSSRNMSMKSILVQQIIREVDFLIFF